MKAKIVIVVAACLWAVAASGQIDPNSDGIGIYADLDGLTNQVELEVGVALEVYLLLTRPSGDMGLAAWECSIIVPDNVSVWGWSAGEDRAIVITDYPGFAAAYPEAHPYQAANLLMRFILMPMDSEPAQFFIEEYPNSYGQEAPRYLNMDLEPGGDSNLIDMVPYPGGQSMASFTVNPEALAVTSETWGAMKALYR